MKFVVLIAVCLSLCSCSPPVNQSIIFKSYNGIDDTFERIQATSLVGSATAGSGVAVAIYDDGVNCNSQALQGKCISNSNGNFFLEDSIGLNPGGIFSYRVSTMFYPEVMQKSRHGNEMAQILAGAFNAQTHQIGIAPGAKVIAYPYDDFDLPGGLGRPNSLIHVLNDAYRRGAKIASISVQDFQFFDFFESSVFQIRRNPGIVGHDKVRAYFNANLNQVQHPLPEMIRVVIAGNRAGHRDTTTISDRTPLNGYPPDGNMIVVGAVDSKNHLTPESLKPGNTRGYYVVVPALGATSPTAPLVSGALALLVEKFPGRLARIYVRAILDTATRLEDADVITNSGPLTGCGLLNLEAAARWLTLN